MRIIDVEQNTDEWLEARLGVPTASAFNMLVTGQGLDSKQIDKYGKQLAIEEHIRQSPKHFFGNSFTNRGHDLEPDAIAEYEFIYGADVQKVGFCVADNESFGFSPDGLVADDGLIEVKCLEDVNHLDLLYSNRHEKKVPTKYLPQVQGQLLGSGRTQCDLYFYHPQMDSLRFTIIRDCDYQEKLQNNIYKVLEIKSRYLDFLSGNKESETKKHNKLVMEL